MNETSEQKKVTELSWDQCRVLAQGMNSLLPAASKLYGVPRGGVPVALLLAQYGHVVVGTPETADAIVDDIVDSGRTREKWTGRYPSKPFLAMVDKTGLHPGLERPGWVRFPWEETAERDAEENVVRMLQFLGEDPGREGLRDTPRRVVKAWRELTAGYAEDPASILRRDFPGHGYDQMVCCRRIQVVSTCEHHLLQFSGWAWVAYIPNERVVGLSKMSRLVKCFMRRLQIQEKLTKQVAEAMQEHLDPKGVGVLVQASHSCMKCRGVMEPESDMVTTALLGAFREPAVRAEFLTYCNMPSR
jgi:GTP cyclohydrolase I